MTANECWLDEQKVASLTTKFKDIKLKDNSKIQSRVQSRVQSPVQQIVLPAALGIKNNLQLLCSASGLSVSRVVLWKRTR